jgi:hypothetical protein
MANVARKRLKKKVLDRWENEGGRICDPAPAPAGTVDPCDPERQIEAGSTTAANADAGRRSDLAGSSR